MVATSDLRVRTQSGLAAAFSSHLPDIKNLPQGEVFESRAGGIRTHDPYTPSVVRYQTALQPAL